MGVKKNNQKSLKKMWKKWCEKKSEKNKLKKKKCGWKKCRGKKKSHQKVEKKNIIIIIIVSALWKTTA